MELKKELIGDYLASLRKSKGLSQQVIADEFCVTNKTVSKWETGVAIPDIQTLMAIAEFYQVSIDDILKGGKESKNAEVEVVVKNQEERRKLLNNKIITKIKIVLYASIGVLLLGILLSLFIGYGTTNGFVFAGIRIFMTVGAIGFFVIYYIYKISLNQSIKQEVKESIDASVKLFILLSIYGVYTSCFHFYCSIGERIRPSIVGFFTYLTIMMLVVAFLLILWLLIVGKIRKKIFSSIRHASISTYHFLRHAHYYLSRYYIYEIIVWLLILLFVFTEPVIGGSIILNNELFDGVGLVDLLINGHMEMPSYYPIGVVMDILMPIITLSSIVFAIWKKKYRFIIYIALVLQVILYCVFTEWMFVYPLIDRRSAISSFTGYSSVATQTLHLSIIYVIALVAYLIGLAIKKIKEKKLIETTK